MAAPATSVRGTSWNQFRGHRSRPSSNSDSTRNCRTALAVVRARARTAWPECAPARPTREPAQTARAPEPQERARGARKIASESLELDWRVLLAVAGIGIVGSFAGHRLGRRLPQAALRRLFGVFLVVMGLFIVVDVGPRLLH